MSGTLIAFFKTMTKPRMSVAIMPPIHSICPICGLASATIQPPTAKARTMPNSDAVFIMTSSMVTRPVWTGPADGWL